MMTKLSNFFLKNLGWKILSLVLAIAMWFIGMNVNNPTTTVTYRVNLTIKNVDKVKANRFVLLNEDVLKKNVIEVRVRASRNIQSRLNAEQKKLVAYIDLNPVDTTYADRAGQPQSVNIELDMPYYLGEDNIVSRNPSNVEIMLDRYETMTIPVTVERVGEAKEGYVSLPAVVTPEKIKVSGARSELSKIESARVQVSLEGAASTVGVDVKPVILDGSMNDITSQFEVEADEVHVEVPINKYDRIKIQPTIVGNVVENYYVASVTIDPEYAQVVGEEDDLNAVRAIVLDAINIDNASGTRTQKFDLQQYLVGTNLSIRNGTPIEVTVTVKIEKESVREIYLPLEQIRIEGQTGQVELPSEVNVVVKGSADAVNKITAAQISASIDVTGLPPGEYELPVELGLPAGLMQVGEPVKVSVVVSGPEETELPEEGEVLGEETAEEQTSEPSENTDDE